MEIPYYRSNSLTTEGNHSLQKEIHYYRWKSLTRNDTPQSRRNPLLQRELPYYLKTNHLLYEEIPYYIRKSLTIGGKSLTTERNPSLQKGIHYYRRKTLTRNETPYYRRKSLTIEGNPLLYNNTPYNRKKSLTISKHKHNLQLTKMTNIGNYALACTGIHILKNTCSRAGENIILNTACDIIHGYGAIACMRALI